MGIFDRRRSNAEPHLLEVSTDPLGAAALIAQAEVAAGHVTASSAPVAVNASDPNGPRVSMGTRVVDPRQARARTYASLVSFVGNTYRFMSYQASRCPWTVEVSEDTVAWEVLDLKPEGAPKNSTDIDPSAAIAWDLMRSIQPDRGSQADMTRQMVYLDDTIGEFYLIEISDRDRISFIIRDSSLCSPESKRNPKGPWIIQDVEGGKVSKGTARRVDASRVYRHWQDDPNSPLMATSSLIGLVEDIDTYWSLIRHLKREVRSRLAMNRVFWTPTAAHAEKVTVNGVQMSKLNRDWAMAVAKAVNDETDQFIETFAPFLLHSPGDQEIPQIIDLGALGGELLTYIEDSRTQVASSLPLSTSFILDSADTSDNHWNEWLADDRDEETIRARAQRCLDTVTEQIYRPSLRVLKNSGLYRGEPELTRISFDPSVIRRQLDNSVNAKYAFEKGLIKEEVIRRDLHYSEADAPDDVELARIMWLQQNLWRPIRITETGNAPAALPAADGAVPNNGTPPAELAALATFIDDTDLLELTP